MGRKRIPRHSDALDLDLDDAAMRAMLEAVGERVLDHLASLPEQPLHATRGGQKLARSLRAPMPERGAPLERILRLLFGRVLPATLNTASPGYMAYVPGGGLFAAALADFIALSTNRYSGLWVAGPGLVQLEQNVIDWLGASLGLPRTRGGLLLTGGSLANLVALVTARRNRLPPDFLSGVVYTSNQAHHSVKKAALIAGFPEERVRALPSDAAQRLELRALERAIAEDRAAGLTPFCVVAHAGTTNTGAVDDLTKVARIAKREKLWLHVDAAYGGFFAWTERGRQALRGIERADSVTLDPHKGLFLPYGTGALVVRDREALRRAHHVDAAYLPPRHADEDRVDFCDLGPELSREARGLRVWLPLTLHGAGAFRRALDEKLDLAELAADRLATLDGIDLLGRPKLSLVAFRFRPAWAKSPEEEDAAGRALLAFVNARQRALLTGTTVDGRFVARICILSFRTHRAQVEAALEDLAAGVRSLSRAR